MAITKTQLARLAFARLREIAPNETFEPVDQNTIELEIDLCKSRLESSVFGGVTLWTSDSQIPARIVEGFLLSLVPSLATHYTAVTAPSAMIGEGYRELCRQFAKPYNAATLDTPDTEPLVSSTNVETTLLLDRGQDFEAVFRLIDGAGDPLDLAGYDVRLQARTFFGENSVSVLDVSLSAGTLTLTDPGEITLPLTAAETSALSPGRFPYKVELIDPSLKRDVVQVGTLVIKTGILNG